ncbi:MULTISPECIES: ABC transporter permease [Streptomycetaceae]|uniref:Putative ABC-type dipeptide/oligopeptide transport systems, permease component n=1 Tax=Streptantibioticus cattleyicolor (strain ATCC 35852 / DSM 46488 / JCM 4925 / NBRC 14057 / NRRL 8057) TaxID=1003195 RepID=F8K2L1_STREN|nr:MULTISPECIES: ABC transporter permease [Streptomycetaceae]AEW97522.1 putative ABC-type dipeptide/oligopeptide transport systems, permease component [Streptantibioticus cattleyicolor NRRL 8057 = DSM 46488]MYS61955.1 ABC transporter permease subunit [Streptomyces sp. SID5468]CCB77846.1 putative oligopeptide ABC transporter, permease protein [Streptantibioticus cattleyicolor NRRL 8057 = DSM 46488]
MSKQSGSLRRYILTRIALAIPMVLILLVLVFVMMRVAPGDPIAASQGGKLSAAQLAAKRHAAGFDRPLYEQFWEYLKSVATLNFGTTFSDNLSVRQVIIQRGGATLSLSFGALIVAGVIGIPLGLVAGRFRDRGIDVASRLFAIITYAAPAFVLGLLAQLAFGPNGLGLLPSSGQSSVMVGLEVPTQTHILILDAALAGDWSAVGDIAQHLVLPSVTLGLIIVGVFIRMIRVNVIQTLQGDYVEAARARGIKETAVVTKHAFRNALVPVVTVLGLQVAMLLGGSVLTEETFNWQGIGQALIQYINARDYAAVQGIVTVFALVVVVISMLIDFVNALIDPRVRY